MTIYLDIHNTETKSSQPIVQGLTGITTQILYQLKKIKSNKKLNR